MASSVPSAESPQRGDERSVQTEPEPRPSSPSFFRQIAQAFGTPYSQSPTTRPDTPTNRSNEAALRDQLNASDGRPVVAGESSQSTVSKLRSADSHEIDSHHNVSNESTGSSHRNIVSNDSTDYESMGHVSDLGRMNVGPTHIM